MIRFNSWSVCVLIILFVSSGCSESGPADNSSSPKGSKESDKRRKEASQEVTLQILDDQELMSLIESKRGKVVVMDIWSTSCDPCVKEFPHFVEFSRKYPDRVACISLSLDYEGLGSPDDAYTKDPVLGFLREQEATMDNVLASVGIDEMCKRLNLSAPPTAFVYDAQGKLQKVFDDSNGRGYTYEEVEKYVLGLLGGN